MSPSTDEGPLRHGEATACCISKCILPYELLVCCRKGNQAVQDYLAQKQAALDKAMATLNTTQAAFDKAIAAVGCLLWRPCYFRIGCVCTVASSLTV